MDKKAKFELGQLVRVVRPRVITAGVLGKVGRISLIREPTPQGEQSYNLKTGRIELWVDEDELDPVTDEPGHDIQLGTKVRVTNFGGVKTHLAVGREGSVEQFETFHVGKKTRESYRVNLGEGVVWCYLEEIEVV